MYGSCESQRIHSLSGRLRRVSAVTDQAMYLMSVGITAAIDIAFLEDRHATPDLGWKLFIEACEMMVKTQGLHFLRPKGR
jgi:hypothetical protein